MVNDGSKICAKNKKQIILEHLWLTYYNDTLFSKGIITEEERNKIRIIINRRQA